jgi:four helix bundle protein
MDYSFRSLVLWQEARDLSLAVIRAVEKVPRDRAADVLVRQIVASSASIAANIAEGHGRFSKAAYRNHLSIARGSACETDGWLDIMRRTGYISEDVEKHLHDQCLEVIRMLTFGMKQLQPHAGVARLREEPEGYRSDKGSAR